MIRENIESVEERICAACRRAGRDRSEVSLICVTKTKPVEMLQEAYDVGQRDFGENKVQEICRKKPELPADIRWHMIGHLQRNKVRQLIGQAVMIHSVDSLRLAETISTEALRAGIRIPVLIEVNMAGEESKYGVSPEQTEELIRAAASLEGIKISGLMTIAPYTEDPETNRPYFAGLRELAVDIGQKCIDNVSMSVLSMGMTGDFEVAILINAMKFNDDDDYDDDEEYEDEEDYGDDAPAAQEPVRAPRAAKAPATLKEEPVEEEPVPSPRPRRRFGTSAAAPADRSESSSVSRQVKKQYSEAGMEVCIIKPTSVDDAREVTDTLLANSTVVLNLEGLDVEIAQRIIDFTSGSCYAVHGNVMKISHYIFVITPANVDVSGDISTTGTGVKRGEGSSLSMPYGGRNYTSAGFGSGGFDTDN